MSSTSQYANELRSAAANGDIDKVEQLLSRGAEVNAANKHTNETSLHRAAAAGHREVVALLLRYGAKVNAAHKHTGATPLHGAAAAGYQEVVALLLEHGAEVNAADKHDETSLHKAVAAGHREVVALLLIPRYGAKVNAVNKYGETSLHRAAEAGYQKVVALLLQHRAEVNATSKYTNEIPLHRAVEAGHMAIAKLLIDWGADVEEIETKDSWPENFKALIENASQFREEYWAIRLLNYLRPLNSESGYLHNWGVSMTFFKIPAAYDIWGMIAKRLLNGKSGLSDKQIYDCVVIASNRRTILGKVTKSQFLRSVFEDAAEGSSAIEASSTSSASELSTINKTVAEGSDSEQEDSVRLSPR